MSIKASLQHRVTRHADFLLLFVLFLTFRLSSVWFFRPGGYIRDYSDLIFYQSRASWQEYGLFPYRDYWSEYPPLFAWFTLWIDTLRLRIPLWEDERLWYVVPFGLVLVTAESITFGALYWVACRLYSGRDEHRALRVAWLYAGLFLPVYLLGGWFDALPVATIMVGLAIAVARPRVMGAMLFGLVIGVGGLLKLVPLAMTVVLPLATQRVRVWTIGLLMALLVMLAGYGLAYQQGATMTLASLRSLGERSGWSTLYAWSNGYTRLGKVLGDVFDPAADMSLYTSWYPEWGVWLFWLGVGALAFIFTLRQEASPQSPHRLVLFTALTYAILLVAYPAWNPQYVLYLLPFLVLVWPNARGLLYALFLSALVLLEHPIYHNLLGPGYAPVYVNLVEADYKQIFLLIIILRTFVLAAIGGNLALQLFRPLLRVHWLPILTAMTVVVALIWSAPAMMQAYSAGRLATSPLRPLARFLNTATATDTSSLPIVSQQLTLGRQLRPFLADPTRLTVMGGRPGRTAPLPTVAARGAFLYVQANNDELTIAPFTDPTYGCSTPLTVVEWIVWYCNGARPIPIAHFVEGIELLGATTPILVKDRLHLTLFWRTQAAIPVDYTVFAHMVAADGQMIGQWDQMPAAGANPTSTWRPNQVIVDDYQIPLQWEAGVAPYQLLLGLYHPTTGERLTILESQRPILSEARLQLDELTRP